VSGVTSSAALRPGRIGTLEVRNRIVRTAHATVLGIDGIGDDFVAYHAAAARGGVGLTVLEIGAVHPSSLGTLPAFSDDIVDGYRRVMTTVRPLGMRVFQQLWHGGALGLNATGAAPWSASATRPTGDGSDRDGRVADR
jgi:2,4-dienoyl-CoA reductase-like NADH-dependent reductase (Old Yellow Enzyme family)